MFTLIEDTEGELTMCILKRMGDHWIRQFTSKVAIISKSPARSKDVLNSQVRTCEGSTPRASDLLRKDAGKPSCHKCKVPY